MRYFVLSGNYLQYYDSAEDFKQAKRPLKDKAFDITQCMVVPDDASRYEGKFAFTVGHNIARGGDPGDDRVLHLRASSEEDRDDWLRALMLL